VESLLLRYGHLLLFAGVMVEGEAFLLAAAFLAHRGRASATRSSTSQRDSSHDEFVPEAEARRIVDRARDPKRLWIVEAADHRFSDNAAGLQRSLLEAIAWVEQQRAAPK
jgi:fermentation-respiration switch protein FrsA (DUF1100 family)